MRRSVWAEAWAAEPVRPPVRVTRVSGPAAAKVYSIVNIAELEGFDNGTVVTPELLVSTGIVRKLEKDGVKILGNGDFTKSLTVQAAGFTSAAKEKIEANGGKAEVIG